eukprot:gene719-892_t
MSVQRFTSFSYAPITKKFDEKSCTVDAVDLPDMQRSNVVKISAGQSAPLAYHTSERKEIVDFTVTYTPFDNAAGKALLPAVKEIVDAVLKKNYDPAPATIQIKRSNSTKEEKTTQIDNCIVTGYFQAAMLKLNPALKYSFRIVLEKVSTENDPEHFYAVEGLGLTYQVERLYAGGYTNPYSMPISYETENLVLKRPLFQDKSKITKWCEQALSTGIFKPTTVHIFILNVDEKQTPNNHWTAEQAYPVGMRISPLNLESGDPIVMEIITLAYSKLNRLDVSASRG